MQAFPMQAFPMQALPKARDKTALPMCSIEFLLGA